MEKGPLASSYRSVKLTDYIGQKHLINEHSFLMKMIKTKSLRPCLFYGPSGCGKTTLALTIANELELDYVIYNAAINNKKDLLAAIDSNKLIIIDEIHRLNKDRQDILLPYLEDGSILIIACTNANPYHSINLAIRSRMHLFKLDLLSNEEICEGLKNILTRYDKFYSITDELCLKIANIVNGDLRYAINILELIINSTDTKDLNLSLINNLELFQSINLYKDDDSYYDLLSAFQKSIRGSDTDAALIYMAMILKMDDFISLERRLLVIAYEDIGLADPLLVSRVNIALDAAKKVGYPENGIILANIVIELCLAPKSRSACEAYHQANSILDKENLDIPDYLKYSNYSLSKDERYDYQNSKLWKYIAYKPLKIKKSQIYFPTNINYEAKLFEIYHKLLKIDRSYDLKSLKRKGL